MKTETSEGVFDGIDKRFKFKTSYSCTTAIAIPTLAHICLQTQKHN